MFGHDASYNSIVMLLIMHRSGCTQPYTLNNKSNFIGTICKFYALSPVSFNKYLIDYHLPTSNYFMNMFLSISVQVM